MRWTAKQKPTLGDERVKIKFALFPVVIGNEKIWLERYKLIQAYRLVSDGFFSTLEWTEYDKQVL